jgi:hypothetical protein
VLFVQPESALGFTSPVGLGQGCFRLHQRNGMTVAENDLGNRNLTSESPALRAPGAATNVGAPLPLETLLTRVRALVDSTTP